MKATNNNAARNHNAATNHYLASLFFQLFACALLVLFTSATVLAADPAKIFADDGTRRAMFGFQIDLSGDGNTVVVGAPKNDPNSPPGEAYVFTNRDGWKQVATLTASDRAKQDLFGWSVSISGDGQTVVVGAPGIKGNKNEEYAGAAYVFAAQGGWKQVAKLTSSNPQQNAKLGTSVSILGPASGTQYVVVGAPGVDENKGAAYLFVSPPKGAWESANENYRLIVSNRKQGDKLGWAASFDRSGDQGLVVSAWGLASGAYKAYVFLPPREQNGWQHTQNGDKTEVATLVPKDSKNAPKFGVSVSFSGSTVIVGAADEPGFGSTKGAAYVFLQPNGGWEQGQTYNETAVLSAKDGKTKDCLGWSVSTNGYQVIAGAGGKGGETGAAYLFNRTDTGWSQSREITGPAGDNALFGWSVSISATASDPVLGVGALYANGKVNSSGAAFIFAKPPKEPGTKLDQRTSPDSGVSGVSYLSVSGSEFPLGNINPGNVVVELATACQKDVLATTSAVSVVSSAGDGRLVSFLLSDGLSSGRYYVSISDSAAGDANFESSNCSEVNVSH